MSPVSFMIAHFFIIVLEFREAAQKVVLSDAQWTSHTEKKSPLRDVMRMRNLNSVVSYD